MGKMQRAKGRRGETEAKLLLQDRDWTICDLAAGCSDADLIGIDPNGKSYLIEVKNHKVLNLLAWRKQAMEQARKKKLPWMLMAKLPETSSWLVMQQGKAPACYRAD